MMVSFVKFEPRNMNGKKSGMNTMILFSSNPQKIVYYNIELQENAKNLVMKGGVTRDQSFVIEIPYIGTNGTIHRKFIEATFFDQDYNLVTQISK